MYEKRHVLVAAPSAIIARDVTLSSYNYTSAGRLCDACVSHHARIRTGLTIIAVCCNTTMKLFSTFFLLWSLAEVHSEQTFPYVFFMGQTLANHSYVDLSLVGNNDASSVQCITDLQSCCSKPQGDHRGNWFFPNETGNGTRLPNGGGDIHQSRTAQRVDLRRTISTSPSGIYRCHIPTVAVHDDSDSSVRETVYVGIYGLGGSVSLFNN